MERARSPNNIRLGRTTCSLPGYRSSRCLFFEQQYTRPRAHRYSDHAGRQFSTDIHQLLQQEAKSQEQKPNRRVKLGETPVCGSWWHAGLMRGNASVQELVAHGINDRTSWRLLLEYPAEGVIDWTKAEVLMTPLHPQCLSP